MWHTALAVALLRIKFASEKELWELVEAKAIRLLQRALLLAGKVNAAIAKAEEEVTKNIRKVARESEEQGRECHENFVSHPQRR